MDNRDIREEFNIEEASGNVYKAFIVRLRSLLAGKRMVQNRPVLPSLAEIPPRYPGYEIVMRTKTNEVTFLFKRRDLYLVAYRSRNSNTWFEFQEKDQKVHVVPGSVFLGFGGGYTSLEHAGRKKDKDGKFIDESGARSSLSLGQPALRDAVNALDTSDAYDERARSLVVIIQMTSESLRFEPIQSFMVEKWSGNDAKPSEELLTLENSWDPFSSALLRYNQSPDPKFFPVVVKYDKKTHKYTFEQVIKAIALIANIVLEGIPKQLHSTRSADSDEDGRALLEVFEVIINNMDGETPGDLYGTITVTDGLFSQYIYNRESSIPESINLNEKATLTGPTQASVSAMNEFIIEVALMNKDSNLSSPDDDKVLSKGEIAWNAYAIYTNVYDKPLSEKIDGSYGSVTVVYGVLSNAVQAHVEVILINGNDKDPADVYGNIFAGNTNPEFEKHESVLFHRDRDDIIQVGKGGVIPLSRSIVAVPLNSQLIIRADLLHRDTTVSNPGDEIAKGTNNFPAKLHGEVHGFIDGQYGQIKVKVTWIP